MSSPRIFNVAGLFSSDLSGMATSSSRTGLTSSTSWCCARAGYKDSSKVGLGACALADRIGRKCFWQLRKFVECSGIYQMYCETQARLPAKLQQSRLQPAIRWARHSPHKQPAGQRSMLCISFHHPLLGVDTAGSAGVLPGCSPSFVSTSTRSAVAAAACEWVTIMPDALFALISARMSLSISCAVSGSRLPVGSSASTSFGQCTSARAMATRCNSPPDS